MSHQRSLICSVLKKPAFDKFGQWNLGDYEGKIYSEEQLLKEWLQEETEINETENFNYSRYGGYLNKRVKSTGFFRTEQINDRFRTLCFPKVE